MPDKAAETLDVLGYMPDAKGGEELVEAEVKGSESNGIMGLGRPKLVQLAKSYSSLFPALEIPESKVETKA